MNKTDIFPPPRKLNLNPDGYCDSTKLETLFTGHPLPPQLEREFDSFFSKGFSKSGDNSEIYRCFLSRHKAEAQPAAAALPPQGYRLTVTEQSISVEGADAPGYRYGMDTLCQILALYPDGKIPLMQIEDHPALLKRGAMLDISRGKVYTLEELKGFVSLLSRLRYTHFQLYTEHSFAFSSHPAISAEGGALNEQEITALGEHAASEGIELQANLQSFSHLSRLLTRPEYRSLAESPLYWTLSPVNEKSYQLLDQLFAEYLPLFKGEYLNVCSDETYDLGDGASAQAVKEQGKGQVYLNHLLRLRELAGKYGKKIMAFGDIIVKHPELIPQLPDDMIFLDWIYDPKPQYETPALFGKAGKKFWVCPGSGQWNSLFPRLDGALINIERFTLEGLAQGAEGMLYTDWNDHGGYALLGCAYYGYAHAAQVSWRGEAAERSVTDRWINFLLDEPEYARLMADLAAIYHLPPIWSKNRSQCVMALFDEPIFGRSLTGPLPPDGLKAYELDLPAGCTYVHEEEGHHPLRPFFALPPETLQGIRDICGCAGKTALLIKDPKLRNEMEWICRAFTLLTDKVELGKRIRELFASKKMTVDNLLDLEEELRLMLRRYVRLQLSFADIWRSRAKDAEIEISLTYFAHIIERLDYLKRWICRQRQKLSRMEEADYAFVSYETAGYGTLPTF